MVASKGTCPLCGEEDVALQGHLATPSGEGCEHTPLTADDPPVRQICGEANESSDNRGSSLSPQTKAGEPTSDGRKPSENGNPGDFDTPSHEVSSDVATDGGVTER